MSYEEYITAQYSEVPPSWSANAAGPFNSIPSLEEQDDPSSSGRILEHTPTSSSTTTRIPNRANEQRPAEELRILIEHRDATSTIMRRIRNWLDEECLKYTTQRHPTEDPYLGITTLVNLALVLSTPLERAIHSGSAAVMERQLRTLIATLALLRLKQVYALHADDYQQLWSDQLPRLWSGICSHHRGGTGKIRQAANSYLVQLALQYLMIFQSVGNIVHDTTAPLLKIVFAGFSLAGQQYGQSRQVIEGICEIAKVWRRVKPEEHPICGLHEHIRRATTMLALRESGDGLGEEEEAQLLTQILPDILQEIDRIFNREFEDYPTGLRKWHWLRRASQTRPPPMDRGYFFLGLLDCVSQLAVFVDLNNFHRPRLFDRLKRIVFETEVSEFRWKAVEALLSHQPTRQWTSMHLRHVVTNRPDIQDWSVIGNEVQVIEDMLDRDEESGERVVCVGPTYSAWITTNAPLHNNSFPQSTATTKTSGSQRRDSEQMQMRTPEMWREQSLSTWKPATQHSASGIFRTTLKALGPFESVGFSTSCDKVSFLSTSKLCVFESSALIKSGRPSVPILNISYKKSENLSIVAMGQDYVAVNLSLDDGAYLTVIYKATSDQRLHEIRQANMELTAMTTAEDDTTFSVIASQFHRTLDGSYRGEVLLSRFGKRGSGLSVPLVTRLGVRNGEYIKTLSATQGADCIAAITNTNTLHVWKPERDASTPPNPFTYRHGEYNPDMGRPVLKDTGLTSVSIFRPSESQHHYALSTSLPSLKRHHSNGNWATKGEWPYITPVISPSEQPLPQTVQNLTQFSTHGELTSGCASSTTNIFAVLTKTRKERKKFFERDDEEQRRIQILRLQAHEQGGIHCPEPVPEMLPFVLQGRDCPSPESPCAIRWDKSGMKLWAADSEGRVVVTEFEGA